MGTMTRGKEDALEIVIESILKSLREINDTGCCESEHLFSKNHENSKDFVERISSYFSSVSNKSLESYLKPVKELLLELDESTLLQSKRDKSNKHSTNKQKEKKKVKPIHDMITPATSSIYNFESDCSYVRYLHVTGNSCYSIGIFVFPPNAKIPLHDHPGMCVLSRVLYGDLHLKSYDIVQEEYSEKDHRTWISSFLPSFTISKKSIPRGSKRARKATSKRIQTSDISCLFPYQGNMHEFTAGNEGAAVIDVLIPPYEDDERECHFYSEKDAEPIGQESNLSNKDLCWLIPIKQPSNFHCVGGQYGNFSNE